MRPVPNLTLRREDGRVVAESVTVADSTMRRLRGLLGKGDLPSGQGILLRPAWSIHTAFMRFPIDVVFLDADQVVIKIVPRLAPFKTASCRGAREVIELRAGECDRRGLSLGDRVAWAARANVDDVAAARPGTELTVDRRGSVVLASKDQRYLKLVRFLLDGKGIDGLSTVLSTAEAVSTGFAAAMHAFFYNEGDFRPTHLVQHMIGAVLKDNPEDLKKVRAYFNHVVKSRDETNWRAFYEARTLLD